MGSNFHSAHLCTADEAAARTALATVCQGHNLRAWVSPLIGRWLSFFPKDPGAAVGAARELSDRCQSVVLLTALHDDAVFSYQLFSRGALADEFVSHPDHFGALNEHERLRVAGDPMQLDGLLDWPEAMFKLVHLLQHDRDIEASVMMRSFFQVAGIVNGLSSYAGLEAGEHNTVALWSKFAHVPDLVAEQRARFALRRRIRHDKQHLRAGGMLLFDSDLAHAAMPFRWFSVHCVDVASGGFICSGFNGSRLLQVWSPPAVPRDLPGPAGAFVRYGEWRALARGTALVTHIVGGTAIVERTTGAPLPQYAPSDVHLVAADEATACGYFLKRSVLEARSLHDGELRYSLPVLAGTRRFIVHPRKPHVIWFSQRFLGIFEKTTGRQVTELELFNPLILPKKAAQWRERDVDPAAMPEMSREDFLALELSADGEWVFAGTSEGLRMYRYDDLVDARIHMPSPVDGVETSTQLQDHQWVHALAVDTPQTTVLFSTGGDTVHSFNWRTGATRQLTPSFEHKTICQMWLSPETRALVCWLRGPLDVPKRRDSFSFTTWNLDALFAQAIEA